jgi:hypothetical protein
MPAHSTSAAYKGRLFFFIDSFFMTASQRNITTSVIKNKISFVSIIPLQAASVCHATEKAVSKDEKNDGSFTYCGSKWQTDKRKIISAEMKNDAVLFKKHCAMKQQKLQIDAP